MYRSRLLIASLLVIPSHAGVAAAVVPSVPEATAQQAPAEVQAAFNRRYKDYFGPDSQVLLPFSGVEKPEWKKILETKPLRKIYIEPDKYYNSKVYSFTLYQATDDGSYYLDAKAGFWGMDELIYGPIPAADLK